MPGRLRTRSSARSERGAALVELAFVMPILLVVVYAILDFGIAVNYWLNENHLAASGARLAVVDYEPSSGTLEEYIRNQAETAELRDGATVTISYPDGCSIGDPVKVTVEYEYAWLSFLTDGSLVDAFDLDASSTIRGTATMRLERARSGCA